MKNEKPSFREVEGVTTMELPYAGLKFNSERVGPLGFNELRDTNYGKDGYGKGFWMPAIPEIVPLIPVSLENKNRYYTAKNVVKTLEWYKITGNTAIHYCSKGMFVEDVPSIGSGVLIDQGFIKILEERLGKHEEKRVVFSDDGYVRFTPNDFKRGPQSAFNLVRNSGVIALAGSEENAERLAEASEYYKARPYFHILEKIDSPTTRFATLDLGKLFDHKLIINANVSEDFHGCSYGVQGIAKEEKKK